MVRDINVKKELTESQDYLQNDIDIPMPSSCLLDMGVSISGGFSSPSPFNIEDNN
jgi:hypothetical protein